MNTRTTNEESKTQIGQYITNAMADQGMSIRDLALAIDVTYEHVRRVVKGEAVPSKFMLRLIAEKLKLPVKEMERHATADRINKKYGGLPPELTGKNPELAPIERIWDMLSEDQKTGVITMAQSWAKLNRAHK